MTKWINAKKTNEKKHNEHPVKLPTKVLRYAILY